MKSTPRTRKLGEAVGRAVCILAQASDSVTRVTCGIPQRLK